jgi:probable HAF family extracellular repeat protein
VAVNNAGAIVGSARDAAQVDRGAMWHVDPAGTITGPVSLGLFFPADINESGEMVGLVDRPGGAVAAIASFDANNVLQVTTIGTLEPKAINNLGEVVGVTRTQVAPLSYIVDALRWTAADGMTNLGNLGSDKDTEAYDLNDNDQIVGTSGISGKQGTIQHGFVWQNGKMTDLNSILSTRINGYIYEANGINSAGQIVGNLSTGHACLLTPH